MALIGRLHEKTKFLTGGHPLAFKLLLREPVDTVEDDEQIMAVNELGVVVSGDCTEEPFGSVSRHAAPETPSNAKTESG